MGLHQHDHFDFKEKTGSRALLIAFSINLLFTAIEWFGGWYTNSLAIISDAFHDLGDTLMLGAALYFERLSARHATKKYTYGYRRFSTISSLINSTVLAVGSLIIAYNAIPKLFNPSEVDSFWMIIIGILGLLFNGAAVMQLRKESKGSLNLQTAMLHLMEDVLGWVGVLIGAIIIHYTNWLVIDPILSILIAVYIFYGSIRQLSKCSRIILQATPANLDLKDLSKNILAIDGALDLHDLRAWSLDGEQNVLSFHLVVKNSTSKAGLLEIKQALWQLLRTKNIHHFTVEMEYEDEIGHQHYS